jgi:hypothetical protein
MSGTGKKLIRRLPGLLVVCLVLTSALTLGGYKFMFPVLPDVAPAKQMTWLYHGWTAKQRDQFYRTAQGALIMPYSWFFALEQPEPRNHAPFASPANLAKYNLVPAAPSKYNPDGLPIGITRQHVDSDHFQAIGCGAPPCPVGASLHRDWLTYTCAACHLSKLNFNGQSVIVDGGRSQWNFTVFNTALANLLVMTRYTPGVFDRFATKVLRREKRPDTDIERSRLRKELDEFLRGPTVTSGIMAMVMQTYPTEEGYGRLEALGRGANGQFGPLDARNVVPANAPVVIPPLWYSHDYDWVLSVTASRQPLGRNVTEAWGLNAAIDLTNTDPKKQFHSSIRMSHMFFLETLVSVMSPPKWPERIFGPVDTQAAELGRYLFEEQVFKAAPNPADEQWCDGACPPTAAPRKGLCARCHAPTEEATPNEYGKRYWRLPMYKLSAIGTDPLDATNFQARKVYTGKLKDKFGGREQVSLGEALQVVTSEVMARELDHERTDGEDRPAVFGFRNNDFRAPLAYPARPLNGYWATPPYLHNGSVPNLDELLSPVTERPATFWTGSQDYDPVRVGYKTDWFRGGFQFQTNRPGNSNRGHEFRDAPRGTPGVIGPSLSPRERHAIIEYMKVLPGAKLPGGDGEFRRRSALVTEMEQDYRGPVSPR